MNPISKIRNRPLLTKESYLVDALLAVMEANYDGNYDPARYPDPRRYIVEQVRNLTGDTPATDYLKTVL
jgi:hypothetical protein